MAANTPIPGSLTVPLMTMSSLGASAASEKLKVFPLPKFGCTTPSLPKVESRAPAAPKAMAGSKRKVKSEYYRHVAYLHWMG